MDSIKHLEQARAPQAGRRICLLVLGMHRSGTSALTRVLSIAGAALPADLMGATSANELGHWESNRLFQYHDRMLAELGSSWDDWRALDFSKMPTARRKEVVAELAEILVAEFGDATIAVVKDPRICRFAPLFSEALERAGFETKPVIAFRSPLEVVQSLERRDGMPRSQAALLWLRHVLDADGATRNAPRALLSYGRLLESWQPALKRLSQQLSLVFPHDLSDIETQVDAFLSPEQRNHTTKVEEVLLDPLLRGWVSDAYSALLLLEQNPASVAASATLDRIRGEFEAAAPIMSQLVSEAKALHAAQIEQHSRTLAEARGAVEQANAVLDATRAESARSLAESEARGAAERVALNAEIQRKQEAHDLLVIEMNAKQLANEQLNAGLSGLQSEIAQHQAERARQDAEAERLRAAAQASDAALAEAREKLADMEILRASHHEMEKALGDAHVALSEYQRPSFKNSVVRPVVRWVLNEDVADVGIENERLIDWLVPNFQNYADGEAWAVNPNGAELTELAKLLDHKPDTTMNSSPLASRTTKSLLLVSEYAPSFAHAGGLRVRDLYAEIKRLRPDLRISLYCPSAPAIDGDISWLSEIFDEVYLTTPSDFSFIDFTRKAGRDRRFDVVDFQFHRAGRLIRSFGAVAARTLFTPMECLSRSVYEQNQTTLRRDKTFRIGEMVSLARVTLDELRMVSVADETVCVSDADAAFVQKLASWRRVTALPTGLSDFEFGAQLSPAYQPVKPSAKSRRLVYAAYFGSDTNRVGLSWFLDHVHPHILRQCPDYKLSVVGRGDLAAFIARKDENVTYVGEVPVMPPVLEQARAGIVLALHGSGFRGKINQYAICGLPSISTNLGVTGLAYTPGDDILTADDPHEFAFACVRVLADGAFADELALRARATALKHYRWDESHQKIREIYGL